MTSVVELFPKSRKLAYDARQQLSQVQNGILPVSELFLALDELHRQLDIMESLVTRETPAQREMWKRKIHEVRQNTYDIRKQGEHFDRNFSFNLRQQRERDELLTRRRIRSKNQSGMEDLTEEYQSIHSSQNMMSDIIGSAESTYTSLRDQRNRFAGISKVLVDIGNVIGITSATMRVIEKRDVSDAYLVAAGMVVTLIVIYFCYFY